MVDGGQIKIAAAAAKMLVDNGPPGDPMAPRGFRPIFHPPTRYLTDVPAGALWVISMRQGKLWALRRIPLPEESVGQVVFDDAGRRILVMARNQKSLYLIENPAEPKVMKLVTPSGAGFRGMWGTAFAEGGRFLFPGYFHDGAGTTTCDALARLSIDEEIARAAEGKAEHRNVPIRLSYAADIHWLRGRHLPPAADVPYAYWIESAERSYVITRRDDGVSRLVLLQGRDRDSGRWIALDSAAVIIGLSAYHHRVEYLARSADGTWEVRWQDVTDGREWHKVTIPADHNPTYPELAHKGRRPVWAEMDWVDGHLRLWSADTRGNQALPPKLVWEAGTLPGPIRVSEAAPVFATQLPDAIVIGEM